MTSLIFKEGDTVYLKTGGPAMTACLISNKQCGSGTFCDPNNPKNITGHYDNTDKGIALWVVCKWQENGEKKEESFPHSLLTKEKPSS